jgi:carbamoyltransferase
MIVLGINGLGVLPSASILVNGKIIAFVEEERFTRVKGSEGLMPKLSVEYCLKAANIKLSEIDYIAFGWDAKLYSYYMPFFFLKQFLKNYKKSNTSGGVKRVLSELWKYHPIKVKKDIKRMLIDIGLDEKTPPIRFVSHHLSHAASSFYCSGFEESLILIIDGSGEYKSTSLFQGKGLQLKELQSFDLPNSIGWFYQTITEYLGFKPNHHEGKLMALAAYGQKNELVFEKMNQILKSDLGQYHFDSQYSFLGSHSKGKVFSDELEELLGPARSSLEEITQYHKDIAYATQYFLEKACLDLILPWIDHQDFSGNLCIAGGVALNCKMNGVLAEQAQIKKIYVPPHSSDNGTALGAAFCVSIENNDSSFTEMKNAYWGPQYDQAEILKTLKSENVSYQKEVDISQTVANLLHENKVIAWFQGRMEVGSRALGNRSILANPSNILIRDFINQKIKNRETWRPFAASILEGYKEKYLVNSKDSPFMTLAFTTTKEFQKLAPAAIHIDGTTRPQIVNFEENPLYYQLIEKFGNLSGVYALLNTSFNLKEEPIICTPQLALNTFLSSEIDYLVLGDYIISKK